MKARPILMSAPMVRALLEGRKTQTRRIMKPQPVQRESGGWDLDIKNASFGWAKDIDPSSFIRLSPYGKPGDLLYVRESFCIHQGDGILHHDSVSYKTDGFPFVMKPSIHMPRWASRLTLEITDVRVQRLQKINHKDVIAEGVDEIMAAGIFEQQRGALVGEAYLFGYKTLWESINGAGSWEENPWVWVLTFKVHKRNVDDLMRERAAC